MSGRRLEGPAAAPERGKEGRYFVILALVNSLDATSGAVQYLSPLGDDTSRAKRRICGWWLLARAVVGMIRPGRG